MGEEVGRKFAGEGEKAEGGREGEVIGEGEAKVVCDGEGC